MVGTDALKKTRKDDDRSKKSKEEVRGSAVLSVLREGWYIQVGYIQDSWLWILMSSLQPFSVLPISANLWQCLVSVRSTKCGFYSQTEPCAALSVQTRRAGVWALTVASPPLSHTWEEKNMFVLLHLFLPLITFSACLSSGPILPYYF